MRSSYDIIPSHKRKFRENVTWKTKRSSNSENTRIESYIGIKSPLQIAKEYDFQLNRSRTLISEEEEEEEELELGDSLSSSSEEICSRLLGSVDSFSVSSNYEFDSFCQ